MTASAVTPLLSNHQAPLRQQKGYSIIELSIALAIISIILVTALAGVQRILRSNNVNSDLRGLNLTAANLATLYSSQPDTSVVAMPTLVGTERPSRTKHHRVELQRFIVRAAEPSRRQNPLALDL